MKTIMYYVPKLTQKFFSVILAQILRLFCFVYRIVAFCVSLACIGITVMGIFGAIAEFAFIGVTEAAFLYLAIAAAGYALRCVVLGILPYLFKLQTFVDVKAHAPIRESAHYGDNSFDDYYDDFYSYR